MTKHTALPHRARYLRALTLLAAAITFGIASFAGAQVIKDIDVQYVGGARVAEGAVLANMKTSVGDSLDESVLDEDLKRLYESGLVENVNFLQEPYDGGMRLIVMVEARAKLREILFIGNSAISTKKLRNKILLAPNETWDDLKLQEARQDILDMYAKRGYSAVDVTYGVDSGEDGFSRITFSIDEGERTILDSISFEGNTVFTSSQLSSKMKLKERKLLRIFGNKGKIDNQVLEDDVVAIENYYRDAGYVNARVMEAERRPTGKEDHVDLVLVISEGTQHSISGVSVSGVDLVSEDTITTRLQLQPGMVYSAKAVREDVQFLREYYGRKGYADLNVIPQLTSAGDDLLNIEYSISEGIPSTVGEIRIRGNEKTQDRVIRRELAILPGEPFNTSLLEASAARLRQLPNFSQVDITPSDSAENGYKDISISVVEKPTGSVNFGAGFSSIDNLVGFVDVIQTNFDIRGWPKFTGAGQKFRLSLKYGTERRDFAIDFTEPWLFDKKLSLSVGGYYRDIYYNSDYYDERHAGTEISLRKPMGEFSYGKLGYRLDFAKIHNIRSDASEEIKAEEGDYTDSMLFVEYTIDTRDSFTLPREGHKLTFGAEFSGIGGDVETYGFEIGGAQYYNGPLDTIFSVEGIFRTIDSYGNGDVPIFKREFLGGARNLRGYDYRDAGPKDENGEPLGGRTSAYFTAEVSTPIPGSLGDKVRVATFYDVGTVSTSAWNFDDVWSDVGIGLRLFILPGAPIRLDYGYPLQTDEYTGSSGQFNFQMGWNF
ncbi:MAG: outer membrane protein assembly factor BamA [Verrucomicrobiales bacterium]